MIPKLKPAILATPEIEKSLGGVGRTSHCEDLERQSLVEVSKKPKVQ
ncbi:MAG: hypothetical protein ACRD15_22950 [Vicinamibacterales bacterium]